MAVAETGGPSARPAPGAEGLGDRRRGGTQAQVEHDGRHADGGVEQHRRAVVPRTPMVPMSTNAAR